MRKIKAFCLALIVALSIGLMSGCMMINAQKMSVVKGTYRLTSYLYTPEYERKEGYTPTTIDYIADKGYEEYLVITGNGIGYLAHKDNESTAYITEVQLSYTYDEEETSKVRSVHYKKSTDSDSQERGVQRKKLNYYKPSINYTQLFTKKEMTTSSWSMHWEKVDSATDLSYVKEKMGEVAQYSYDEFATREVE